MEMCFAVISRILCYLNKIKNMKKTVIMHFYNEAKMLKWWLPHHIDLFDEGILINHSSTDLSVDICRSLAPHWRVVDSKLTDFKATDNDLEVMMHEAKVDGWKMVLNASEFLVCGQNRLNKTLSSLESDNKKCLQTRGAIMVDNKPGQLASERRSLVQQKCYGYFEDSNAYFGRHFSSICNLYYHYYQIKFNRRNGRKGSRNRIIHSHLTGNYEVGRHATRHKIESFEPLYTFWYGFSPWNRDMISRKQQFSHRIPEEDFKNKRGFHHFWSEAKLQEEYQKHLKKSGDLKYLVAQDL